MNPNGYNMLNRPMLRAPAVHCVSSFTGEQEKNISDFALTKVMALRAMISWTVAANWRT